MPIGTLRRSRLSSVMARPAGGDPSGPLRPAREVDFLVRSETVYPHAHRFELQARDLAIDLLRHRMDLARKRLPLPDEVLAGESLIGEGHVHDRRRVAFRGRQVDEPALAEQVDSPSIAQCESVDVVAHAFLPLREGLKSRYVDLDVEVAGIGDDSAVFHRRELLSSQAVL